MVEHRVNMYNTKQCSKFSVQHLVADINSGFWPVQNALDYVDCAISVSSGGAVLSVCISSCLLRYN